MQNTQGIAGDTVVHVTLANGFVVNSKVKLLVGKKVKVWNGDDWVDTVFHVSGTKQEISTLELRGGDIIRCTPFTRWSLSDGTRLFTNQLDIGDMIKTHNRTVDKGFLSYEVIDLEDVRAYADLVYDSTEQTPYALSCGVMVSNK